MKLRILFAAFLLLAFVSRPTLGASSSALVFTHVTVIDATGAPAQPDMTVVIANGRIAEIGKSASVHVPKNGELIDAAGKFLIPGLWDMHMHWENTDYLPLFLANG